MRPSSDITVPGSSKIRIRDGRAKPIDLLAKYISAEDDDLAVEMHEPYTFLNGLTVADMEDLLEDIQVAGLAPSPAPSLRSCSQTAACRCCRGRGGPSVPSAGSRAGGALSGCRVPGGHSH